MPRSSRNPLAVLLREAMAARGLSQGQLQRRLAEEGVKVSRPAVSAWLSGGGVSDEYRAALAEVLGLTLGRIQRAAYQRAIGLTTGPVETLSRESL